MFGPPRTPPQFKKGFALSLALRPSQIKAIAQDGALMNREVQSLQETYADLAVPVAVLAGERDRIIDPGKQSLRIHGVIKQSSLTVLPGLGHMLHHEAPDQIVKVCHGLSKAAARLELPDQRNDTGRGSKLR
jgi:pimeloyl-ACP methyl ester carboxylesterase